MIGNNCNVNRKLYESLLHRVKLADDNIKFDKGFEKNLGTIERDLMRTLPELKMFRPGQMLHQSLKNILAAFSIYRPDLGYV
jgi:hypothetical protein